MDSRNEQDVFLSPLESLSRETTSALESKQSTESWEDMSSSLNGSGDWLVWSYDWLVWSCDWSLVDTEETVAESLGGGVDDLCPPVRLWRASVGETRSSDDSEPLLDKTFLFLVDFLFLLGGGMGISPPSSFPPVPFMARE